MTGHKLYLLLSGLVVAGSTACGPQNDPVPFDHQYMAAIYYDSDSQWYKDNIPFFECSDKQIEQVYYYRWKLYKAHIRNVGPDKFVITEFINHVSWDRDPWCTINAASMHHIYEGRWLKDDKYINGYVDYLFQQGGNNRRYSESVADAAWANYMVNADKDFVLQHLDSMKAIYNAWSDHYDSSKNLYYIPAMPDATEYTIASIDASGGKAGFDSGEAFRPTINSYMYGNAMAIAKIAALKGDQQTNKEYLAKAANIKKLVEENLWNDSMQHFVDRYKQDNQYVHYWDFIRGRELAGFAPWYFNLPADNAKFSEAWRHITDTSHLLGQYGLRTNEPSYEHYFKQFVWYEGQRGSQWNGPGWPYQSSQALTAMANMLNNYKQQVISPSNYVKILRLYTQQHFLPNGKINLVENYDPNLGGPIVYYYWSNHYLHSTFNNLVITGLCGIRPSQSDTLVINPLVDKSIKYFSLTNLNYHGHQLNLAYDIDGSRYNLDKGLMVWIDGKKTAVQQKDGKNYVVVGAPVQKKKESSSVNFALNIGRKGYPIPSASINTIPDTSLYQAIDGRIWYFPEITNYWSTRGSKNSEDWYMLNLGESKEISAIKFYLYADDKEFFAPQLISLSYDNGHWWAPLMSRNYMQLNPKGNTVNYLKFDTISARAIKFHFHHPNGQVAVSEIECY